MMNLIKNFMKKVPFMGRIFRERDKLYDEIREFRKDQKYPPGHFYSPIHSINEIKRKENNIFFGINTVKLKEEQKYKNISKKIPDIDLNEER